MTVSNDTQSRWPDRLPRDESVVFPTVSGIGKRLALLLLWLLGWDGVCHRCRAGMLYCEGYTGASQHCIHWCPTCHYDWVGRPYDERLRWRSRAQWLVNHHIYPMRLVILLEYYVTPSSGWVLRTARELRLAQKWWGTQKEVVER